jgi:hypothetical protein
MQKPTSLADYLQDWEALLAALDQNLGDLPQLQIARNKLDGLLEQARTLLPAQAAQTAAKQSTSQQLEAVLTSGRKVATVIRFTVKEHYGNRSEKLTEFRMQPFRSRTVPPTLPAPESSAPDEPSSTSSPSSDS